MKIYLLKIYGSKKQKNHNLTDLEEATNPQEAEQNAIGKKHYFDSYKTKIFVTCKKAEVIREI
jgi:hypothetical protein